MLSCISIGISDYKNSSLCQIPCAASDAQRIYDAFQAAMGNEFDKRRSFCVTNPGCIELSTILSVMGKNFHTDTYASDSILVLYFSGHAILNEATFELLFPNYMGTGMESDDKLDVTRFAGLLPRGKLKLLLILDCCSSGAALPAARGADTGLEISVLTSGNSFEPANFDETGSFFTNTLCQSILEISRSGEIFSLKTLVDQIHQKGYPNAYVHRGAAQHVDLIFRSTSVGDGFDKYLPTIFVNKIAHSNALSREAMWYSLSNLPDHRIMDVCEQYFDDNEHQSQGKLPPEASWLVRRAIGSTLANHILYPPILELLYRLLESEYWQEQCIALIGLRYIMRKNSDVCRRVIHLVETKKICRIDAVWLAALYTSDNKLTSAETFLTTSLSSTPWGMIELCKIFKLFDCGIEAYSWLKENRFYPELFDEERRIKEKSLTSLASYVYYGQARGRLPENTQTKFLLSALYGNWRDQITINLTSYLNCHSSRQIMDELEQFSRIQNAERKMALFAYFQNQRSEDYSQFFRSLSWGLQDPHPWVRRTAIEFYQEVQPDYQDIKNNYFSAQFEYEYPGLLDYYLTCPTQFKQAVIAHIAQSASLSQGDMLSLKQSFSCE